MKISLMAFITAIACGTSAYVWVSRINFNDVGSAADCKKKHSGADDCGVWDYDQCRKGAYQGNKCVAHSGVGPLILAILCGIFIVMSVVYLMLALSRGKKLS